VIESHRVGSLAPPNCHAGLSSALGLSRQGSKVRVLSIIVHHVEA
jgi:hypothetical protein